MVTIPAHDGSAQEVWMPRPFGNDAIGVAHGPATGCFFEAGRAACGMGTSALAASHDGEDDELDTDDDDERDDDMDDDGDDDDDLDDDELDDDDDHDHYDADVAGDDGD